MRSRRHSLVIDHYLILGVVGYEGEEHQQAERREESDDQGPDDEQDPVKKSGEQDPFDTAGDVDEPRQMRMHLRFRRRRQAGNEWPNAGGEVGQIRTVRGLFDLAEPVQQVALRTRSHRAIGDLRQTVRTKYVWPRAS